MKSNAEAVGDNFSLESLLRARIVCLEVVETISQRVMEGMSEVEGQKLVKQAFAEKGVEKFWHPTKFRIGTDTTKTFRDPPDSSIRLTSGEIYFLDVGPIVDGHEADYGFTFQFGSNGSVKKIHTPMQRLRCGMPVGLLGRNKRFLVKPCYRWGEERPKKEGIV